MRPRILPQDWLDAGFTALLCVLVLLAWGSTYRGAGLWFAGGGAILVGIGVAVAVVALGGGLDFVVLGLLLAYVLGSGPVAGGGLFDDVESLGEGVRATIAGWPLLTGTHPPIDASGPALLPVVLLCLAASGITAALAMRSETAAAPLRPMVLVLVSALLLSRAEPVSVLLHGLVFGVLALVWLRVRSGQADVAEAGSAPGRRTRVLAAAAMVGVGALVATLVVGTSSHGDRMVLRGVLPAYDVSDLRTPLDGFRDYTRRQPAPDGNVFNAELARVRGAAPGTRLRFAALDTYDGTRWTTDNDTDPERVDDRFLRLSSTIDNPASGERAEIVVSLGEGWALPWVPTAGALQGFGFLGAGGDAAREKLRYDPATQTAVSTDQLAPGDDYVLDTVLADTRVTGDLQPSRALDEGLYEAAAFLDPAVLGWSQGAESPADAVLRVAERLRREGFYSDGAAAGEEHYAAGHSPLRLGKEFVLTTPSVGNDEQYAAAMALMANRLRVPARVVVGAVVPDGGVVRGKHVGAWVELRAADGTWQTLDTDRFMGRRPPPHDRDPGGQRPDRIFPEQTPDDRSPEQRPEPQRPPEQQPEEPDRDADRDPDRDTGSDPGPAIWPWLGLLLLLSLPGVVPALKWWRRRRRLGAARVSDRYAGAWLELVDQARDLGRPVPPGLTRPAQARALERGAHLAAEADVKIFGADEPGPAEAEAFWALVRDERAGLRSAYPPWQRFRAALSLASLRARRR
jgi:hypothetical protein